jgi:hydrogenase maturation protein HypF
LYDIRAESIVCDAHPGYTTHRWAGAQEVPVHTVWHHRAHASAVAAESHRDGAWLMFAWDGVGFGEDGTLWGGEALLGTAGCWQRVASFRPFRLPGGDKAGREPWRSAAALQWSCNRQWPDSPDQDGLAHAAWQRQVNSPATSAAGRLFDAAAALIGRFHFASFEAQGPMYLESLVLGAVEPVRLPLEQGEDGVWRTDWAPLLDMMCDDSRSQRTRAEIFHSSMAATLLAQARQIRKMHAVDQVGFCGGVFQNRALAEQAVQLLSDDGFEVILPSALPCNDAALSYGQAAEIAALAATRSD